MWFWMIIETAFWVIFGTSESKTLKRHRFRKRFGVEYDTVLGRGLQEYLKTVHDVPDGWKWKISIESADRTTKIFRVKYDDCGGRAGVVEVHGTESSPSYRKIDPERIGRGNK